MQVCLHGDGVLPHLASPPAGPPPSELTRCLVLGLESRGEAARPGVWVAGQVQTC